MDTDELKKYYKDFQAICAMSMHEKYKVRLLTILFGSTPEAWRVVGITDAALRELKNNHFEKRNLKVNLNRAHLQGRSKVYKKMMGMEQGKKFKNFNHWWKFYFDRDKTIICLAKGENKNIRSVKWRKIDYKLGCFKNKFVGWTHGKEEGELLEKLAKKYKIA